MRTSERYDGIQALRFVAALLVVITHSMFYAQERMDSSFPIWKGGTAGVDIFFVISGFVMMASSGRFVAAIGGWKYFIMRRVARIVPIYWIATTVKILIMVVIPGAALHAALSPQSVIFSYLFLPTRNGDGDVEPLLGVGWTLTFEMFYYLVFALGLLFRVNVYVFSSVVMALFAAGYFIRGDGNWPTWAVYFDQIVLYFVIGMTIAKLAQSRQSRKLLSIAVGALAVTSLTMALLGFAAWDRNAIFRMVTVAGIVAFVVWLEPYISGRLPRPLLFMGDASYSMYLFHPIFAPAIPAILVFVGLTNPVLSVGVSIVAVIIMAAVIYQFVERPVTKAARKLPFAGRIPVPKKDSDPVIAQ